MEKQLFYDENNNPVEFYIDAKFSIEEQDYVAMYPVGGDDDLIYILKIVIDSNGEEVLMGIDEEELEEAKEAYEELLQKNEVENE